MYSSLVLNYDLYAVIGNPVSHSKSPFIHALFADQTGERIIYKHRLSPVDEFDKNVYAFIEEGGRGANVTVPFKINAYKIANTLSDRASAAGSVNTLSFYDGHIFGDNTDGVGLVRDIELNLGVSLNSTRILLIGAGGAARGAIMSMLDRSPLSITIINRTKSRADMLVNQFSQAARKVGCILSSNYPDKVCVSSPYDIIINATTSSLDLTLPDCNPKAFGSMSLAYDMMYSEKSTIFMRYASSLGARVSDGLGMLVEQAAESFKIWRGVRPKCTRVLAELTQHIRFL